MRKIKTKNLKILLKEKPESYYWIGFILADGCLMPATNRICIGLSIKDIKHLKKFRKYINSENKLSILTGVTNFGKYTSARLSLCDSITVPKLEKKFDIKKRKTYNPPNIDMLKNIQNIDNLISMFIGFIDGDGGIYKNHNRPDSNIRIKIHKSWNSFLEYITIKTLASVGEKIPNIIPKLDKYIELVISNSIQYKFLKRKAVELKLPILIRKWNNIDLNYISKMEKYKKNLRNIKICLKKGLLNKEIQTKLNIKAPALSNVLKRNNLKRNRRGSI